MWVRRSFVLHDANIGDGFDARILLKIRLDLVLVIQASVLVRTDLEQFFEYHGSQLAYIAAHGDAPSWGRSAVCDHVLQKRGGAKMLYQSFILGIGSLQASGEPCYSAYVYAENQNIK